MAELYPAPFANLIDRVFREFSGEGKIFDLPRRSFYRADPNLSTDVSFLGRRAATPVGPAAGPQSQLAQNIVLAWLAGARIIELKTIQINDRLEIPRPCIDVRTIGFNVEWSQELRLEDSLREYVAAWMLIRMIREAGILDREEHGGETIFDLSVGYDLEGIQHPRVSGFIRQLQDATTIIEELRAQIPDAYGRFRDIDYDPHVIGSATLSTFHGCPAGEIEQIVDFLMTTFHLDVVIKMNPTLLGYEGVERLLHETLGYTEIELDPSAFEHDLQFDEALVITKRLAKRAKALGVRLGVKFSNTLVVKNHDTYFSEDVMYMSGPPLHVITLNLVDRFRKAEGGSLPISFSAGVDQKNFPDCVAMGFTPITTCTDLLRPGGYARLPKYLYRLHERMNTLGVRSIGDFVLLARKKGEEAMKREMRAIVAAFPENRETLLPPLKGLAAETLEAMRRFPGELRARIEEAARRAAAALPPEVPSPLRTRIENFYDRIVTEAALLNTPEIVAETTRNPRYAAAANRRMPKKIGSKLLLYDCINCDKCVPVCPNDANFVYEVEAAVRPVVRLRVTPTGVERLPAGEFEIKKQHQLANFADFCNECGNCDVFCPEDGGPYIVKPRFFGSLAAWERFRDHDGFFIAREERPRGPIDQMWARFDGREFLLRVDHGKGIDYVSDGTLFVKLRAEDHEILDTHILDETKVGHEMSLAHYFSMTALLAGVLDTDLVNYINVGITTDAAIGKGEG